MILIYVTNQVHVLHMHIVDEWTCLEHMHLNLTFTRYLQCFQRLIAIVSFLLLSERICE